jgi:hypothetical protein
MIRFFVCTRATLHTVWSWYLKPPWFWAEVAAQRINIEETRAPVEENTLSGSLLDNMRRGTSCYTCTYSAPRILARTTLTRCGCLDTHGS